MSTIGVFLGLLATGQAFGIVMGGIGIGNIRNVRLDDNGNGCGRECDYNHFGAHPRVWRRNKRGGDGRQYYGAGLFNGLLYLL